MKHKTLGNVNLALSIAAAVGWVFTLLLCAIGVSASNEAMLAIGGLLMFALWAVNVLGIVVGICACTGSEGNWRGWLPLSAHAIMLIGTAFLTMIGIASSH